MDKPITRKEFDDLRNLVYSLIKRIDNDKYYDSAEKNGIRQTEGQHGEAIDINASDVAVTRGAIEELYEMILNEE